MTIFYMDAWKDNPYAKLAGEKGEDFFRIYVDEGSFHEHEGNIVLAGWFKAFSGGVTRKFKPLEPINAGLCEVTFYADDYKVNQKGDDGKWNEVVQKASAYEKSVCQAILKAKDDFIGENLGFRGWFDFVPDLQFEGVQIDLFDIHKTQYWNLEPIVLSGKHPTWKAPQKSSNSSKGKGYVKGISLEDKHEYAVKQLKAGISSLSCDDNSSLLDLVYAFCGERRVPDEAGIFLKLLTAILSN